MMGRSTFTVGAVLMGAAAGVWSLIWFPREAFLSNDWALTLTFVALVLGALGSARLWACWRIRSQTLDRVRKRAGMCALAFAGLFVVGLFLLTSAPGPLIGLTFFVAIPSLLHYVTLPIWGPRERNAVIVVGAFFCFNHVLWFFLGALLVLQFIHAIASLALMATVTFLLLGAMRDSSPMADRGRIPLPAPVQGNDD